ncbi:hypothetical protein L8106_30125 [Lyngbya sp. PCC 8106]|nr:hypothetical protein L8106_30125 [Lyngbya sp. PCC 8106]
MKITILLLITAASIIILINKINQYCLTLRSYPPQTSQVSSQPRLMTLVYQLLFWGLVLPWTCLKFLINRSLSRSKVKQSPPKLYLVKGTYRGKVGVKKIS